MLRTKRRHLKRAHLSEVHEVFEAGVQMRLLVQAANGLEVRVVHVRIHPEHALEDGAYDVYEVIRKWCTKALGKHPGIINLHSRLMKMLTRIIWVVY